MTFSTPMMRQYWDIKKKYSDCLVFFRMGDFYELFLEDAHVGSSVLNITLTKKSGGKDGKIPMAGVPYHAVDNYIAKLVKSGYKVAICEQLSPPNKKGLVKRDVVRVITPGTLLDEKNLERKENNNIVSISLDGQTVGISVADLSTGYFATDQFDEENIIKIITDVFSRLSPSECILPEELYNDPKILEILSFQTGLNVYPYSGFENVSKLAEETLLKHFKLKTLEAFGISDKPLSLRSSAGLLSYLKDTQKGDLTHIQKIDVLSSNSEFVLDRSTILNLELLATIRDHETKGSLLHMLDQTITPMGGRLLRNWLLRPLNQKERIDQRLEAVSEFMKNSKSRDQIRELLQTIPDMQRLVSRLSVGLGNARDLIHLKHGFETVLDIRLKLESFHVPLIVLQTQLISPKLKSLIDFISDVFVDEPPILVKDGGMIKSGVNVKLDTFKKKIEKSKSWIVELEKKQREETGISSLKVRFNKVFGFYIEISKSNLSSVPDHYIRKQTLVNAERFITKELKEHEEIVLTAEEKIKELEYEIYIESLNKILKQVKDIQDASEAIAVVDCLLAFSFLSEKENYVMPKILYSGEIKITQGRHPVVEKLVKDYHFVPNDTILDTVSQSILLITGPNMAGKSVYIRQVALIVLMAHIGCFVPAQSAYISLTDRIFVRSGASDVITSGLSTFMVEMVETAYILHNATEKSLIVMDEIGRGTSTYDGISIAWSIVEYLVSHFLSTPKTLFATHYHELQNLEQEYPRKVKNFHMAVTEEHGEPVFLHAILPGGASHSFGVSVAKLAGIPSDVITRAKEILATLENRNYDNNEENMQFDIQTSTRTVGEHLFVKELETIDIATMTPLEALNVLSGLKDKVKLLTSGKSTYVEVD